MNRFRSGCGLAVMMAVSAYASRADAAPAVTIVTPAADGDEAGDTLSVQATVTDDAALTSVVGPRGASPRR